MPIHGNDLSAFSRTKRALQGTTSKRPYFRNGKTFSESLSTPAAAREAEGGVVEFRNFQQLSRKFIEANAKICHLRPIEEESETEQKKTAEAIRQEVAREVDQLLPTNAIFTA